MATISSAFDLRPHPIRSLAQRLSFTFHLDHVLLDRGAILLAIRRFGALSFWVLFLVRLRSTIEGKVHSRPVATAAATAVAVSALTLVATFVAAIAAATPATVIGAAFGYYLLFVFQYLRRRQVARRIPHAVSISASGCVLEATSLPQVMNDLCSPLWQRTLSALVAAVIASLTLSVLQSHTGLFQFLFPTLLAPYETTLAWISPILVAAWFMTGAGVTGFFGRQILSSIDHAVANANHVLSSSAELEPHILALNIASWSLRADPGRRFQHALEDYVRNHAAEVAIDASGFTAMLASLKTLALQETRRTQVAVQMYQNTLMQFRELRGYARAAQDPKMKVATDTIGERLAQSQRIVELQDWTRLAENLRQLQAEMQAIDTQLTMHHGVRAELFRTAALQPKNLPADPYEQLGIPRDFPTAQLRRLRLKLVQIYHPDAADACPNPARMADINSAVDLILKWRGEK